MIRLLIKVLHPFRKKLIYGGAVLVVMGVIYLRGCASGKQLGGGTVSLPAGTTEQIKVDLQRNSVSVQTHAGTKQVQGVRNATVTVKDSGEIVLSAPTRGFVFEPGLGAMVDIDGPRIGPDVCWAYIGRFDFLGGVAFSNRSRGPLAVAYVAVGYNPPFRVLTNTDLFVGYGTNKNVLVGVRVAF